MKRSGAFVVIGAVLALVLGMRFGGPVVYTATTMPRSPWANVGSIDEATTTPVVAARTYALTWDVFVEDNNSVEIDVPENATYMDLRFRTDADGDAHVIEVYVAANDFMADGTGESFTLGTTLTLAGGKQQAPGSTFFCDTITEAATSGILIAGTTVYDDTQDRQAMIGIDLLGHKKVWIIATTLQAGTTLYVDAKWR